MITNEMREKALGVRLAKAYDTPYNYRGQVMTMRQIIAYIQPVRATAAERTREMTRRGLEYKELSKPVVEYMAWYSDPDGRGELGLDVPKIIYDDILAKLGSG